MSNTFLTNYTETTFLDKIKDNLRKCKTFDFSVSFIKKAGLVLLFKDIEAAVEHLYHSDVRQVHSQLEKHQCHLAFERE